MFDVINPNNDELISIFSIDYKGKIKLSNFFTCRGCGDVKCVFVNASKNTIYNEHFRHSKFGDIECPLRCSYKELNNDYCRNLFNYIDELLAKRYILDTDASLIKNVEYPFLIKHNILKNDTIEKYEDNTNSKIVWLLDFNKRYGDIFTINSSYQIFIKFNRKNDIPFFNPSKSIVYLDTGYDIIIHVDLSRFNKYYGYLISLIKHTDFFQKYNNIFNRIPERTEWKKMKEINDLINIKKYEIEKKSYEMKEQKKKNLINKLYNSICEEYYDTYDSLKSYCNNKNNEIHKYYIEYFENLDNFDNIQYLQCIYSLEFIKDNFYFKEGKLIHHYNNHKYNKKSFHILDEMYKEYKKDKLEQFKREEENEIKKKKREQEILENIRIYEQQRYIREREEMDNIHYSKIERNVDFRKLYKYNKDLDKYWNGFEWITL